MSRHETAAEFEARLAKNWAELDAQRAKRWAELDAKRDREWQALEKRLARENRLLLLGGLVGGVLATLVLMLAWPYLYVTDEFTAAGLGVIAALGGYLAGSVTVERYIDTRRKRTEETP